METLKQRLLEHIADLLDEPTFDISMRIQDCIDPLPNDQSELHLLMTDAAFKVFCTYFSKEDTTKQCAINGVVKSFPTETDDFLKDKEEQLRLCGVSGRSEQFVCLCPRNEKDNCDRKEPCKECETCAHLRQTNCH